MAISRIKTSSVLQGFPKSRSLLAGNAAFNPSSYESIATVTVGSGGSATIDFTSIPATYTHLQLRGILRESTDGYDQLYIQVNSDTGNNYAKHALYGDGSTVTASGNATQNHISVAPLPGSAQTASVFAGAVIDILDYKNTNKYKTIRSLAGVDTNGSGYAWFSSGVWQSTNAITSIKLYSSGAINLAQYSQFALYGIKGA
jgi:hypothetical protein